MSRGSAAATRTQGTPSGVLAWIFSTSPWLLASVIAVVAACTVDLFASLPRPRTGSVILLAGLAVFFGLVHGTLWSLLWVSVGKLPNWLRLAFWPLLGLGAGLWLAGALGAYSRLHSRYWQLASAVLAACSLGGLAFGVLCAGFQPQPDRPPYLLARDTWLRMCLAVGLALAAAGLWFADRKLWPGQYLYGHLSLRLLTMWAVMMALVAAGRVLRLPRVRAWGWLLVLAGFAACLLMPNPRRLLPSLGIRPWPALILRISQQLTDWDRDGYSAFLGGGDCAPWNPRVHPGAREIPDNGIDDNCLLGDSSRRVDRIEELPIPKEPAPMDVVLITVDSLRPDHLGVYNRAYGPRGRGTSPNLDRFAREATVFERAYTAGAWTSMAVPSLLRGVYPRRLHWTRYFETTLYAVVRKPLLPKLREGELIMRMFPLAFDDRHPSISSMLERRGMYTVAVTDDGHSEMLQPGTGLERGFAAFREVDNLPQGRNNDAGTADLAIAAVRRMPVGQRFFLWVHFFGIHWPDEDHPGVREYGPEQADKYDHEVAFFDQQCGRLLEALNERTDPVAIFIAADHGEGLAGGIRQHGLTVDEAVIKIPFIARVPGWPAKRMRQPVSSIDLVPTVLALTGTPAPAYLDGVDLGILVAGQPIKPRVLFSDTWRFDGYERLEINYLAAFDGVHKVVLDRMSGGVYELNQRREVRPTDAGNPVFSSLTAALYGYLEETGGALDLSE